MLIVSQNLTNYEIDLPQDAIFRVNLAWVNNLKELEVILGKHRSHKIFLDLPTNRTKPPNNKYGIDELIPIIKSNPNIKYFAVSNVNSKQDLEPYVDIIPETITRTQAKPTKIIVSVLSLAFSFLYLEIKLLILIRFSDEASTLLWRFIDIEFLSVISCCNFIISIFIINLISMSVPFFNFFHRIYFGY